MYAIRVNGSNGISLSAHAHTRINITLSVSYFSVFRRMLSRSRRRTKKDDATNESISTTNSETNLFHTHCGWLFLFLPRPIAAHVTRALPTFVTETTNVVCDRRWFSSVISSLRLRVIWRRLPTLQYTSVINQKFNDVSNFFYYYSDNNSKKFSIIPFDLVIYLAKSFFLHLKPIK